MKMIEKKKLLIFLLAIICILIALGAYMTANNHDIITISDNGNNITVNDSISDIANSNENGTIWLEENGTLKEVNVTESSGYGSVSS